ncbi:nucleoside-diphosphate sugar epimerase/dehydratase [Nitratifractor sp.]|uniref:nucleoside-diphosphate sugar epimerase/dehydratase n=1 Tax=Nitratifractor sp. TaxID=2268144 RepID=UPI0025FC7CE5|nr:nucleoside-diphosphate sugar epimerase/dehydratase [Nitratifractor sp.]
MKTEKRAWLHPTAGKRTAFFLIADILLSLFTLYSAYLLRFNFHIPPEYLPGFWKAYALLLLLKIPLLAFERQYRIVWRFYSLEEARRLLLAHVLAYGLFAAILWTFRGEFSPFPRSVIAIDFVFSFAALAGLRFLKRLILSENHVGILPPALLIGSGAGSDALVRAWRDGALAYEPVAIVDRSQTGKNVGSYIGGIPVRSMKEVPQLLKRHGPMTVILSEELPAKELDRLVDEMERQGIREFKRLVMLGDRRERLRDLSIEDLLARPPRDLDPRAIARFLSGKSALVTGAGGSIGSELCRQLLDYGVSRLLMVDNGEYNLYRINETLNDDRCVPLLLDVTRREELEEIFAAHRPQLVIHAAAYKHVPLCELNPQAALENNLLGAINVFELSVKYGVEKVVNISSDKAVRPTNVMGASKRIIELYAQNLPGEKTEIVSVRFGNVLGSSGSVVPKFKEQIEAGGPVTVTHPEITRYFMLIPEACQLVLQAAAIAEGGELFILDMGEPVRIADLAKKMIRLYGKEGEIEIVYSGLRPGEKLYEELLIDEAECRTRYRSICVAGRHDYPIERLRRDIEALLEARQKREILRRIVPEYTPTP